MGIIASVAAAVTAVTGIAGTAATIAAYAVVGLLAATASMALGFVSQAIMGQPGGLKDPGRMVSARNALASWKIAYGRCRIAGDITFMHTTGGSNKYLHIVYTIACHPIEALEELWLNDEIVPLDGSGNATGTYAGVLRAIVGMGTTAGDATFNSTLTADCPDKWSATHRQTGHAKVYVRLKYDSDKFPSGLPNITFVGRWKNDIADPRTGTAGWTDNAALCTADWVQHQASYGVPADKVDSTDLTDAADACDEFVALTSATTTVTLDASTDTITLAEATPALRNGHKFQLTTSGSLAGTGLTAATDYYWYWTGPTTGKACTSLANVRSGTAVNLTAAGTGTHTLERKAELRYTVNGRIDTERDLPEMLGKLLASMAGQRVIVGATWHFFAGVWRGTSPAAFGDDDLAGPISFAPRRSRRDTFNAVKAVYSNPERNWQGDDMPAVTSATYQAEDNGERLWKDAEFDFTISASMAQRIARIDLERNRRQIVATVIAKLTQLGVRPPDVLAVTRARYGWAGKTFEVAKWQLTLSSDQDAPALLCAMDWAESDENVYAWDTTYQAEPQPAATTTLPSAFTTLSPQGLTLASGTDHLLQLNEGSVISRIYASWTLPDDGFVFDQEVQWKKSTETAFTNKVRVGLATSFYIAPVEDGVSYDVQVYAYNVFGVRSADAATVYAHVVVGKSEAPPAPLSLSVIRLPSGRRQITWDPPDPLPADVRAGGGYLLRYKSGSSLTWGSGDTALHKGVLTSNPWETDQLGAGTYTFGIKTVDSSGNESASAVTVTATLGDPPLGAVIFAQQEELLSTPWGGTLTSCFLDSDNALHPLSTQTWASLPADWTSVAASWDSILTNNDPIVYETAQMDLGSDQTVTVSVATIGDGTATVTMKTGATADGGVTGAYGALGTATGKRYFKIKVSMAGGAPAVIRSVSTQISV